MGFFSSITGGLADTFGFGDGGAGDAANQIQAANFAAEKIIKDQYGETEERLLPFVEAGSEFLPKVEESATDTGFAARLERIFNSDIFKELVNERTQTVRGQLAAGGLTRSGTALETIADIPVETGVAIEDLLTRRQAGLTAQGLETAFGLGNFGAAKAAGIAGLKGATGQAEANAILGGRQTAQAGTANLIKAIAAGISGFGAGGIAGAAAAAGSAGAAGAGGGGGANLGFF